jgi:hypothetical protein
MEPSCPQERSPLPARAGASLPGQPVDLSGDPFPFSKRTMKSPGNPLVFSAGPFLWIGNPFLFSGRLVIGQRAPFCGETNRSCA